MGFYENMNIIFQNWQTVQEREVNRQERVLHAKAVQTKISVPPASQLDLIQVICRQKISSDV